MHVAVLAFHNCLAAEVFGFADVLLIANRLASIRRFSAKRFDVTIIGAHRSRIRAAGGVWLSTMPPPNSYDLLVVPAFVAADAGDIDRALSKLKAEIDFIARQHTKGSIAAICGGTFLLAEAGILGGRRVTTAWPFAMELARRYPSIRVEPQSLIVRDGSVTTTGAFSAAHDLALALVREQLGEEIARSLAKLTLLDGGRASQAPYVDPTLSIGSVHGFSLGVRRWLERNIAKPYSLPALAEAFHVSTRTLLRRFAAETGRSPLQELQHLRISHAKQLLESSELNIAQIAQRVGYLDLSTFSRLFSREVGISPAAYRKRFRWRAQS